MSKQKIPWKKAAVFDINHGGLAIAKQLLKYNISVTVFDVYQKASAEKLSEYTQEYNFLVTADETDLTNEFDIVCLPIHLDPKNSFFKKATELDLPRITHHETVGRLLLNHSKLRDCCLIEITGVFGKTSSAILTAQMLSSQKRVLLHTSKSVTYWENGHFEEVEPGISIAPAYLLDIVDLVFDRNYAPDVFLFEVSLGFTGAQDIGILTKLSPDYRIAGNTAASTDAKMDGIGRSKEGSRFVIHSDDFMAVQSVLKADQKAIVFNNEEQSERNDSLIKNNQMNENNFNHLADIDIRLLEEENGIESEKSVEVRFLKKGTCFKTPLQSGYNQESYQIAMGAAVAAATEFGVPDEEIKKVLFNFDGVNGRMKEYKKNNRLILDNSNSGLTIEKTRFALDYMLEKDLIQKTQSNSSAKHEIILIIGEEEKTVCEGLEPSVIKKLV